jgi:aspartyl protease family protein
MAGFGSSLAWAIGLGVPAALAGGSLVYDPGVGRGAYSATAMAVTVRGDTGPAVAPAQETPAEAGVTAVRDPDGLFYVRGRVNDRLTRFIVDTGASVVVLSEADARSAGIDVDPVDFGDNMATVGGQGRAAWVRLKRLSIAGYTLRDLDVAIVKGASTSLLGQNALSRLGGVVQDGNRITLR